ncbi:MAG TPA: DNA-3-methyladenine glycosylase [Beijerinckiaceae bacterium]|nr:DNA-3-methyladenine glycosylase [Beijerinckiaceae bacterium]
MSASGEQLQASFFERPAPQAAQELIGVALFVEGVGGIIVETEAYGPGDAASHSFAGPTARNAAMFGPAGRAYVYRSYGIHWCLNFVCGAEPGGAVLLRALQATLGIAQMQERRGVTDGRLLCSGPGRVTQALGVSGDLNGAPLDAPPFRLLARGALPELLVGGRIGVSRAIDTPWRFGLRGSAFLSKPFAGTGRMVGSS